MTFHESITADRVCAAVEESMFGTENPGFCLACGADAEGCEPDAEQYECAECGRMQVYGAGLVLMMVVDVL